MFCPDFEGKHQVMKMILKESVEFIVILYLEEITYKPLK